MASIFDKISGKGTIIAEFAAFSLSIIAIVNVYAFYRNNIWKPTIEIKDVDYDNAVANMLIDGREFTLRGNSHYLISYDYGIAFGTTNEKNGVQYDRIELLKRDMVQRVLHKKNV